MDVDGSFAFSAPADVASGLEVGQCLSSDALEELTQAAAFRDALFGGMRLLAHRPRSRAEILRRLSAKGLDRRAVESAVDRLSDLGLVDDPAFADWWVTNRCQHRPRAAWVLRLELLGLETDRDAVEAALRGVDDGESAIGLAVERAHRFSGLERKEFDRRLGAYLRRRGFATEDVRRALDAAWPSLRHGPR